MSEQIYTNKVSIVHFHIFMSFYSIYAILSRIRFCRDLRFFCVNFWGQKLRLRKFFDKYDVCFQDSCPPRPPPQSRTRWKRPQAFARSQTQTSWKQIMLNNNLGENLEANNVE